MKTPILYVLCEGETEGLFVKQVLKPYLKDKGIIVKYHLLVNSQKKGTSGGIHSYQQVRRDLLLTVRQAKAGESEKIFFTTMIDFYALPGSFPRWQEIMAMEDRYKRVSEMEKAFAADVQIEDFIPYIQLHEFEALVFCGLEHLLIDYPNCQREVADLKKVLATYNDNPELINTTPDGAPGKRLAKTIGKKYNYNKPKTGALVADKVSIEALRGKCRHFDEWLKLLEDEAARILSE